MRYVSWVATRLMMLQLLLSKNDWFPVQQLPHSRCRFLNAATLNIKTDLSKDHLGWCFWSRHLQKFCGAFSNSGELLYKNYSKCHIWIFGFFHQSLSFLIVAYLVTLFDRLPWVVVQCLKITQNVAFCIFGSWHFLTIFVLLKVTCLVILFDLKLQVLKKIAKIDPFLAFLINFCPLKM